MSSVANEQHVPNSACQCVFAWHCLQLGKEGGDAVLEVLADGKLKAAATALPLLEQVTKGIEVSLSAQIAGSIGMWEKEGHCCSPVSVMEEKRTKAWVRGGEKEPAQQEAVCVCFGHLHS